MNGRERERERESTEVIIAGPPRCLGTYAERCVDFDPSWAADEPDNVEKSYSTV